jgi:hypothetical protein
VSGTEPDLLDWIDEQELAVARQEFAGMSDAALMSNFEYYRVACAIHEGHLPRAATMQKFWSVWCELKARKEFSSYH